MSQEPVILNYRAKQYDKSEWFYGTLLKVQEEYFIYTTPNDFSGHVYSHKINPDTVCIDTTWKDKNNNSIWTNDIMWLPERWEFDTRYRKCKVKISIDSDLEIYPESVEGDVEFFADEPIENLEVIGNTIDNPELFTTPPKFVCDRYFIDERVGCIAVRDKENPDYDEDYQGLHPETIDVLWFSSGEFTNGEWNITDDDRRKAKEYMNKLIKIEKKKWCEQFGVAFYG